MSRYTVLYHWAEEGSWESIRELGLLSTTALLARFEVWGERRRRVESVGRPDIEAVEHPSTAAPPSGITGRCGRRPWSGA